jgi:protein-tyrosine-phosphatase
VKLLAVCTANICRSPAIEAAVRSIALSRDVDIKVFSGGVRTSGGRAADPETVAAARKQGFDLSTHVSQPITPELIDAADLVVCAELEHLVQVLGHRPDVLPKSYLLLEFVDMVSIRHYGDDVTTWLDRTGRRRTAESVLATANRYNLSDPYKRGKKKQEATISTIADAADRLVEAWAG